MTRRWELEFSTLRAAAQLSLGSLDFMLNLEPVEEQHRDLSEISRNALASGFCFSN